MFSGEAVGGLGGGGHTDMAHDFEHYEYRETRNHNPVIDLVAGRVSPSTEQPQEHRRNSQQLNGQGRHQFRLLGP